MTTQRLRVYGIVQGVGFRPTVARHAAASGITGTVCNKGPYVEIFLQGTQEQADHFLSLLRQQPPRRSSILKMDCISVENAPAYPDFSIIESDKTGGEIFVSPDIAICEDCERELFDPRDRRYLHPFINCTCCGPRLTILDALPYDRERTSMKEFPMCPACAAEYDSPETRRYDAQPVCCPHCGPQVYLLGRQERGRAAIEAARQAIREGQIVAVKGIGGFHLCCDATNETAVVRLRTLKRRPAKPFAVMLRDEAAARRECEYTEAQRGILTGHQKPILLLKKRAGGKLAPSIAPENPTVGVMLPYTPLHHLLFRYDDGLAMPDCLVMTSGNVSGAPICREDTDVTREISGFCDLVLSHDRKIRIRADDTVLDFYRDKPYMIRRSRGFAPLPVMVERGFRGQVLALGGELKNTFCVGVNDLFYPSPYVGDLEDLRTVAALEETVGRLTALLETRPTAAACDLHPRYHSTLAAQRTGLPLLPVQHHWAHILSCMAENNCFEPVLGLSFDGTGWGTDETIWGGELLLCDLNGFTRLGSIAPFDQIGGDLSAKEGWRIAVSMLYGLYGDQAAEIVRRLALCGEQESTAVLAMAKNRLRAVRSTSLGRLFDGVSAILGVRRASSFEGEAATALQFQAELGPAEGPAFPEPLAPDRDGRMILNTGALVRRLTEARLAGESPQALACRFHSALADMALAACLRAREESGVNLAALSGGCFQNKLLLELTHRRLEKAGFRVLLHSLIPPNDGGLCLGQAVYAMNQIQNGGI